MHRSPRPLFNPDHSPLARLALVSCLPLALLGLLPVLLPLGLAWVVMAALQLLVAIWLVLLMPVAWLVEHLADLAMPQAQAMVRWRQRLLTCSSALLLSACGTAPLQGAMCPPVPAALLEPPSRPALLQPASASMTPGPTNAPMPPAAPPTERATRR